MINGPGTIEEKSSKLRDAVSLIKDSTASGLFASDNLITWGKSLSFLEDSSFVSGMNSLLSRDRPNDAKVPILGTIWRKYIVCWAAEHCKTIDGDFAELGCYAGDTARLVMDHLGFSLLDKTYWMYDMFESDGTISQKFSEHAAGFYERTLERFADIPNVKIIKGIVPDSFSLGKPDKIAFLHIDMNNAPSELAVLEHLYDRVEKNGIIMFDDYGYIHYRAQKDVADNFFKAHCKKVLELPTGQGMYIK